MQIGVCQRPGIERSKMCWAYFPDDENILGYIEMVVAQHCDCGNYD